MTQYAKLSHEELVARCIQMEAVIGFLRQEMEDKRVSELVAAALQVRLMQKVKL